MASKPLYVMCLAIDRCMEDAEERWLRASGKHYADEEEARANIACVTLQADLHRAYRSNVAVGILPRRGSISKVYYYTLIRQVDNSYSVQNIESNRYL